MVCDVGVTEAPPQAPRRVETPIARDRPFAADHHNANGGPAVAKLRTDGIRGMLMAPERGCNDAMVARLLQTNASLPVAGQALVDAANEAGGKDNIAVILVRVAGGPTGAARPWWKFGR